MIFVTNNAHKLQEVSAMLGEKIALQNLRAIDYIVNSARQSVQFLIFSKKYEEIGEAVMTEVNRGVTVLDGTGFYSKQPVKVLCILAKKSEAIHIFRLVKDIDPNAFISQSNVVGVYGEGFDQIKVKSKKK